MGFHSRHESSPPQLSSYSYQLDSPKSSSSSPLAPSYSNHVVTPQYEPDPDLQWPFGSLGGLDKDDIREAAYEVFFTSCRSSPGFGGQNALAFYSSHDHHGGDHTTAQQPGSPGLGRMGGVGMLSNSKVKRALGLRNLKRMPSVRRASLGGGPSSPRDYHGGGSAGFSLTLPSPRMVRKPLTSAEIMRVQMRVTEKSDHRLRKTLMRTLVGQRGRRADTLILPLELLRHLKPSEFYDQAEYHHWQKRQLKILETALLLHPAIPLDQPNPSAIKFREFLQSNDEKPLDTGKSSDTIKHLCHCIFSLAWRGPHGSMSDVCHWADGYPLNLHLYVALLQSVFDHRDDTAVLDEVDELFELMKKTWSTLGINRGIHNVCFTWVLFQQYVLTGQTELDLLSASFFMLAEVASDAKKPAEREGMYVTILISVLKSMIWWLEKKMLNYHEAISKSNFTVMENILPLALLARKILDEDTDVSVAIGDEQGEEKMELHVLSEDPVSHYIASSLRTAFAKMAENMNIEQMQLEGEKAASEALIDLSQATEELAIKEKENYSNTLKKWHPVAAGVAAVALHRCFGKALEQYLDGVSSISKETIEVLHRAGKLEKVLVQMVVEDTVECEDGGKSIVREMEPYEVDSVILRLLRKWIDDKLRMGRECVQRAKETETWNPKSKAEPFAQSAVELMKIAKETVDDFFEIPVGLCNDLVHDLSEGLERVIREYSSFIASCGTKQSYVPTLPPLTRCHRDSKFSQLWKKAGCNVASMQEIHHYMEAIEGHNPRPSTSRGTQRLYIRLNTLHYLISQLNSLDKTLSLSRQSNSTIPKRFPSTKKHPLLSASHLELARASMQGAMQHVAEVSGYRLIFFDSNSVLYETLYVFSVENSRIRASLRILKQNIALLGAILIDHAQPMAMKEVMKASFEAYLMVLLAGGSNRIFYRQDFEMIEEDFEALKRVFCTSGLVSVDEVDKEAEVVEGVIQLMGQSTEQLIDDLSSLACERSGIGGNGNGNGNGSASGKKLLMPVTTGRWNKRDPNTILRVLCHRNDRAANQFLKRTFQLPKRR